ncbi:MAG: phenylalanine--tRNA ligase subunit beta [Actinomycetota bacterium]
MRAPLSWLREFAPIDAEPAVIAEALDRLGLEVEGIDEPGRGIGGVVVARILAIEPHPDADRLRLAEVDFGAGTQRVVCGAPNIEPGMVVPFAPIGAVLPGDFRIERRKIRGVVSEGMLCSARELGLGDDHAGILALAADASLGTDVRAVLGLDDVVFDCSITPNRPDAMGVIGIARELAAHFRVPFSAPTSDFPVLAEAVAGATVTVEAPDRCPRFVAMVTEVAVGPSPDWLQRRLVLAGMRPISNVVDVTNYVMLERCRPLHAFDLDRLAGRSIVVRTATAGERMTTLDGVERELGSEDLLICDGDRRPQGIAGIMGGAEAEVDATTTEILLESAYFTPEGISRTSKRLGLRSEASARFERGVDPGDVAAGAARALELLGAVAAARPAPAAIDTAPGPLRAVTVGIRTDRVNRLLGIALDADGVADCLAPLGITVAGTEAGIPSWRPDLAREIDLVEEVARRVGLDTIPRTVPASPAKTGAHTPVQRSVRTAVDVLVGAGYDEIYSLPLLAPSDLERVGAATSGVIEVENPLRAEASVLRPALVPGLLRAIAHNAAHGEPDVALFEVGTVFGAPPAGAVLPDERRFLAFARAGLVRGAPHAGDRAVDVYDATAVLEALFAELRVAEPALVAERIEGFHPGRAARVEVDGRAIGRIGEVASSVAATLGLTGPIVAAEVDLGALVTARRLDRSMQPVSRFPASTVDLALVVADAVPAAALVATLRAADPLVERVDLFDVFRSEALGAGVVSLAISVRLRAIDRTLTDDDVAAARAACVAAAGAVHGARLRD